MSIVSIVVVLIVVGALLYLVNNVIPMDPKFKTALNVIVSVALVLWIINAFFPFTTVRIAPR